jgi:exonuclease III
MFLCKLKNKMILFIVLIVLLQQCLLTTNIKVLSFNLWNGGQNRKITAKQYADFIRESKIDIAGLQETSNWTDDSEETYIFKENLAPEIAQLLGWNVYLQKLNSQGYSNAIISRFNHTEIFYAGKEIIAVEFAVNENKKAVLINDHLLDEPYQPDLLMNMDLKTKTKEEVDRIVKENIQSAFSTRTKEFLHGVKNVLSHMKRWKDKNIPIFVTADYNEPSFLDWTENTTKQGFTPCAVEWPTSKLLYNLGFTDSYRKLYPDEIKHKVDSWSVAKEDKGKRYDRIDIMYYINTEVKAVHHVDTGFSDHMAVIGTFNLGSKKD